MRYLLQMLKINFILCMYFRLQEKQASSEIKTIHRTERDDLPAIMPLSKRLKYSEEEGSSAATDKRHRTQDRSLERHKSKREDDTKSRTEPRKDADSNSKSSKKKKSKEKKADTVLVTRETNWLSSNLRVRIVDQDFKKGRFYNTKVMHMIMLANKCPKAKI